MRGGLTRMQRQLLTFIAEYVAEQEGMAPSYEEMARAVGLKSKAGIHRLLNALEERGFIRRMPNRARSIFIVEAQQSEFERGRAKGRAEGIEIGRREAIKEFGLRLAGAAA